MHGYRRSSFPGGGRRLALVVLGAAALTASGTSGGNGPAATLSVDDCVRIAVQTSPAAAKSRGARQLADAAGIEAVGAILPHATLQADFANWGPQRTIPVIGSALVGSPPEGVIELAKYTTSISVRQSIIDVAAWLKIRGSLNAQNAAALAYRASLADLAFEVKQAFYWCVKSRKELDAARAVAAQSREQAQIAERQYSLGAIGRPDLLQIAVGLSQREMEEVRAEANVEAALRRLVNLMGVSDAVSVDTSLTIPDTSAVFAEDSLLSAAIKKNPAIAAAKAEASANAVLRMSLRLNPLPVVSGLFTYGTSGNRFGEQFSRWGAGDFWSIWIRATWALANIETWCGQSRSAKAQVTSSEARAQLALNATVNGIRQAFSDLRLARAGLRLLPGLEEQSREEYRLVLEKYRLGAASPLDLLQAQTSLDVAARRRAELAISYSLALARIRQLAGEW